MINLTLSLKYFFINGHKVFKKGNIEYPPLNCFLRRISEARNRFFREIGVEIDPVSQRETQKYIDVVFHLVHNVKELQDRHPMRQRSINLSDSTQSMLSVGQSMEYG